MSALRSRLWWKLHYAKEDLGQRLWSKRMDFSKWYAYHFEGWRPPPEPTQEEKERFQKQQLLIDALDAGDYDASPKPLQDGCELVVEDLEPVMACVTFIGPRRRRAWGETRASWEAHNRYWRRMWSRPAGEPMGPVPPVVYQPWWPDFLKENRDGR